MKMHFRILVWMMVFAVFAALLYFVAPFSACFYGGFRTFFLEDVYLKDTLFRIGGLSTLAADFISQFFITPLNSVLVTAAVLTLISFIQERILFRFSGSEYLLPAALFLPVILGILGLNVNYLYSGTISLLLILIFADIFLSGKTAGGQRFYAIITGISIYPLILVRAMAFISVRTGWAGDMEHLLTFFFSLLYLFQELFSRWSQADRVCTLMT